MSRSIRWRLVASYVLLTLLTVSVVGVLALSLIQRYVSAQERGHLTDNARAIAEQALPLLQPLVRQAALQELAHTAAFLGDVRVRILDDRRQVLADSGDPTQGGELVWIMPRADDDGATGQGPSTRAPIMILPFRQFPLTNVPHREQFDLFEQLPPNTDVMVVHTTESPWGSRFIFERRQTSEDMSTSPITASPGLRPSPENSTSPHLEYAITVPIGEDDQSVGYVELRKGQSFGAEALATARRAFLLAAGGATLLAVLLGLGVSRGLTVPLRALTEAAGQMSSGDLAIRAPAHGKDEIGQLARQFNQMAAQLEASFAELASERDSLQRFIADASHELRTPITALRNFNELLQGAAANDPEARAEFLAESQRQLDRLAWVTHNLLDLSRLDAGLAALDLDTHDAEDLIETTAADFKTLAREKTITLSIQEPPSPIAIPCDRVRIEVALSNLLDNALKFTPTGGQVEIGVRRTAHTVQIWVRDNGPGIASADQPHIFERFYRGTHSNHAEGSGLGLAIVKSVVEAHGGQVSAESAPGEGTVVTLSLPLRLPADP